MLRYKEVNQINNNKYIYNLRHDLVRDNMTDTKNNGINERIQIMVMAMIQTMGVCLSFIGCILTSIGCIGLELLVLLHSPTQLIFFTLSVLVVKFWFDGVSIFITTIWVLFLMNGGEWNE